ncbi:DUF4232 domain-containing protein [Kitasatospora sp. NPDC101183]|uniref:DUF4232 domain-containing protein n=1 Tax=Kitasatospora sp. NPDC101183 TaxID=3364100 RepID=UPI0037F9C794
MSSRRTFVLPAALALGAVLGLTACGPDDSTGAAPQPAVTASAGAPASAAPAAPTGPAESAAPTGTAKPAPASATSKPGGGTAGGGGSDGGEAWAYGHPCESGKVTVKVVARPGSASQRVIEVHNQGPKSCGLSYYPTVDLGASNAADRSKNLRPMVPSGLGGPPAYALGAGQVAYAVIDLNPGGAGTGAGGIDEINVLADGDHMPNADTVNTPLAPGTKVFKPKLGLYRSTVADAAASAAQADHQL